ncbi:unnamed protein product [Dibothriocephalus latus]|uniref:Uncharacterized protein n=1 Tax=Dibothriocephalus latus TaxID=60516 RepID=A0A3P6PIS9_DIBLA|nr:unnamed protein product [Dibothriocephalus latus]
MTAMNVGQKRASSVRKSSLGTGVKRTSSVLAPYAPRNTPVPEEAKEMEAEDGGGGGGGTDFNANFNFPAGAGARQKSNPRLKWIPLMPIGGGSGQAPTQRLSDKKPEWRGFRIGYKKTRPLRR